MLQPLHNYLLIEIDKRPEKIGSIYIPETNSEQSQRGTVLAAGPGRWIEGKFKPCCATAGDRVILIKYAGMKVENYTLIRDDDILAIDLGIKND